MKKRFERVRSAIRPCLILTLILIALGTSTAKEGEPLTIRVTSSKAIINWNSWSPQNEPLIVTADRDDALVFFHFKQLPDDLDSLKVTSNAAVYVSTPDGLIPLTKKARANPKPAVAPEAGK